MLLAPTATAQEVGAPPPGKSVAGATYLTDRDSIEWRRAPNIPASAGPFYPEKAELKGIEGKATIDCAVLPNGGLNDCRIVHEEPEGIGFGAAEISFAHFVKLRLTKAGAVMPPNPRIVVTTRFVLPVAPPPLQAGGNHPPSP